MPRYRVTFIETSTRTTTVEAPSREAILEQWADRDGELFEEIVSSSSEIDGGYCDSDDLTIERR